MEQCHVLVAAGLGVGDAREAVELEAERVPALAAVHVVPKGEDDLQHLAQSLTALNLLARLQHPRHLHQCFFYKEHEDPGLQNLGSQVCTTKVQALQSFGKF